MGAVNLTAGRVAAFKCATGKAQSFLWDSGAPGLAVRATAKGAKSFVFQGKLAGKTIRTTIGDVRTWAIESGDTNLNGAREAARRLQALIDQKIDPRHAKAEEVAAAECRRAAQRVMEETACADAKRKTALVADAWGDYLAHQRDKMQHTHIERGKRWGARHLADHLNLSQAGGQKKKRGSGVTKPGVLYPLLQMRMSDITGPALLEWQRKEAQSRANNARQGFELFRAFWRWCASRSEYAGIIDAQAAEGKDLRDEVPSRRAKALDVLEREYLPAWFAAVRGLSNYVVSAYLQALILTGARREEMAELRWENVDFQWGVIWLKDKVAEEGRKIPLTPYLACLLLNLKRINETPPNVQTLDGKAMRQPEWKPSEWVFFSKRAANGRVKEPRVLHNRALEIAGLRHVTIHGLRRTFASLAQWDGVEMPAGVVAQIMGHKPSATAEKHYIRRSLGQLAVWHRKYEAWILAQAGVNIEQPQTGLRVVDATSPAH